MAVSQLTDNDPLIHRTIEGYEFIKRLGEGTYGMVYLARHPRIKERLVAIKYIKLGNIREAQKAEREIDILARLQHPNVVDIYDAYRYDHYQLIVMELIRGGSLQDSSQRLNGLLDLKTVIEGIEQIAFALGYVHDQNVLHLDLKPANVLLDPVADGQFARFVLTDFGIAQIVNPGSAMSTNLLGTPMYMSPEHFGFGDSKPDRRSDIYSLGIILYELLTGQVPFQSTQLLELLNQHAYSPVPLPSKAIPSLPPMLDNIVLKALAKSPDDRFQTASAMGSALRELRTGPLAAIQTGIGGRVSAQALGAIAQAGAMAMDAIEAQHPPREQTEQISLVIMRPDGSQHLLNFNQTLLILGRDKSVDLVLDEKTVSRRHVQIDSDRKGNLFVTDLDSANGTYLDGVRLPPQERVTWKRDQYLQIQGFLLQIASDFADAGIPPLLMTTDQVKAVLERLHDQRKKPVVHLALSPAIVYVELGRPQYIQVRVTVENAPTATYELKAKPDPGIDENWYTLPAPQTLSGEGTLNFDFIVSMPVTGTVGGETHEIALQVAASDPSIPTAFQVLKVRVVPFTRFTVALRPIEVSHNRRRRAELLITNNGNQPEHFSIEMEAPDTLQVLPQVQQVTVEPAQEQQIRLKFKPARGAGQLRSRLLYAVIVHSASGAIERANGSYIFGKRGRVPISLLLLWVVLVMVTWRALVYGISLPQQYAELRTLVELVARRFSAG